MPTYESVVYPMDEKYDILDVPLKVATKENTKEYGRFVEEFESEEVWIETWPKQGWRDVAPGTGNLGGVVEGDFAYEWRDDLLIVTNKAVGYDFTIARAAGEGGARTHAVCWEFNYHPDGGQVFFSRTKQPFVAFIALPGDDVKPGDFVGFWFDGSCGFQLKPDVWHQAMLPLSDSAEFRNKQGRVYACVPMDTIKEFNTYVRVPLDKELAEK